VSDVETRTTEVERAENLDENNLVAPTGGKGPKSTFIPKVLRPIIIEAKLERRVTFCTDLVQSAGERGLLYACEQAGHSSISITANYYGRATSHNKSLVDALDARVRRARRLPAPTPRRRLLPTATIGRPANQRKGREPSGTRTRDPLIKSQVLFLLS
jgi:hypothetical protein